MGVARFEFIEEERLECATCARRLRRALQRVSGIEEVSISVQQQRLSVAYNPVLLDRDSIGEKLADLGHVVRPVG